LAGESSGHTSSIIFGSANDLNGANLFYEYHSKTLKLGTQHASGILTLRSGNGTDALTLDSSQGATFSQSVDGDAFIALDNVTGGSSSVNETSALRLNLGDGSTIRGGAKITAKKEADFSTGANMDASLTFSVLENNAYNNALVITPSGNATFAGIVKIDQNATDAFSLHIDSEATTTHNLYFEGPVTTTGAVIRIDGASGLTTGHLFNANILSTSMATTATDGAFKIDHAGNTGSNVNNLMYLHNNHASSTGTIPLKIQQDSTGPAAHFITSTNEGDGLIMEMSGTASGGSYITFQYDENASAPSETNDLHGGIRFRSAYSDNTYSGYGASITSSSEGGPPSASQSPGNLVFSTTPTSSTTLVERMRISNGGNVGINEDSPDRILHIKSGTPAIRLEDTATGNGAIGFIEFYATTTMMGSFGFGSTGNSDIDLLNAVSGGHIDYTTTGTSSQHRFLTNESTTNFIIDNNSRISLSNNDSGTSNTIFGKSTATSLDAGSNYNVFVGESIATGSMNDATYNTGVGYQALKSITTGDFNVALGSRSGEDLTVGTLNTFVGDFAGHTTTSAQRTVAIGHSCMASALVDATAIGTVAIGYEALNVLTSGAKNLAIGYQSMSLMQTGTNNIALGHNSMDALQGGDGSGGVAAPANGGNHNIAIGTDAMGAVEGYRSTTEIDGNIAIGTNALLGGDLLNNNIDFVGNIAIGYNAVDATGNAQGMTGTIGIGYEALSSLTSGARNTAVGFQAMDELTTGEDNVAFGYGALGGASTSSENKRNVAIGNSSMSGTNAGASENVAIGYAALDANLTSAADGNTGVGYQSLTAVTSGTKNTAVGADSGGDLSTGDYNTIIGHTAAPNGGGGGENQIVIGYHVTGKGDNTATIGNGDCTDVYMAEDVGATVHCAGVNVTTGINFPDDASANPSGDVNTLDNYEEGTFTPAIYYQNSDDMTNSTNVTQTGAYTKIGNMCHFQIYLKWNADNARVDDNIGISGMPFTSKNTTNLRSVFPVLVTGSSLGTDDVINATLLPNSTVLFFQGANSNEESNMGDDFGENDNMEVFFSGTFITE